MLPRLLLRSCLVAALLAPAVARAQTLLEEPRRRQGYYVSLGMAAAIDHNWKDGESLGTYNGQLITLRLGQLVTRRFGLGLRFDGGSVKTGPLSAGLGGLGVEAQWEIVTNLSVHGTVGLGVVSLSDSRDPDAGLEGTVGAGYTLGLSYDWFFGRRRSGGFALTPTVSVRLVPGKDATALMGLIGLDLSYWTGLPREQLQLPPDEAW
jgi:hypothetical protein